MNNLQIVDLLRNVAGAYTLEDQAGNKFKIIAYERAADAIEHLSSEAKDLYDENKLSDIPGVGPSIAGHLSDIFKTGKSKHFDTLLKKYSKNIFKLLPLPKIGIKTAYKLVSEYKLEKSKDIFADLLKVVDDDLKQIILDYLKNQKKPKRYLLPYAMEIASEIIAWLKLDQNVIKAEVLGSLRRRASTVGDIDIAVVSKNSKQTLKHFTEYKNKSKVIECGEISASILLPSGLQVDLMTTNNETFGSMLQHFTGSKHHNIALREYALKKGWSLSEYGVRPSSAKATEGLKTFIDEENLYGFLSMQYIPPELREDVGEIQLSLNNKLPDLVDLKDIKADLQIHSNFNIETSHDIGLSTMEDIVRMADSLNYEYIALTDHNPSRSKHSELQIIDLLKKRKEEIDKLNDIFVKDTKTLKHVFNSLEIDILSDGKLPISDKALELLDFALVSIHSGFNQSKSEATKRVINALTNKKCKIFAHPTGRKLLEREGVELDWEKIFSFAISNNKWIEINADPMRLDLPDFLVREGLKKGIKFTLGTDSHHAEMLQNMKWGISVARRGFLSKYDIINCLGINEFRKQVI